jgi:hypothetical protein
LGIWDWAQSPSQIKFEFLNKNPLKN